MWPFKKKITLAQSGLLQGLTDCHSHLLPGVDDGFKTLDQTLEGLRVLEEQGVSRLWLTPHIMEDFPNETADLKRRFEELKEAYHGGVELHLASENMLDSLFPKRLAAGDLLPHGVKGDSLLVETSYFNPPYGFHNMLKQIAMAGYYPLLAHPERYTYMDNKEYDRLRESGVRFQINYGSLLGFYGRTAQAKAIHLLEHKMVDCMGGDLHSVDSIHYQLHQPFPSTKVISLLENLK